MSAELENSRFFLKIDDCPDSRNVFTREHSVIRNKCTEKQRRFAVLAFAKMLHRNNSALQKQQKKTIQRIHAFMCGELAHR